MKEVMISIQPKWCELIASGKKTVEVRKTRPKIETPFKVYIYCTQGKDMLWILDQKERALFPEKIASICTAKDIGGANKANGKVIGEFVCDRVIGTCPWRLKGETGWCAKRTEEETQLPDMACLTLEEIEKYAGSRGRGIYGWHITDLVVYDEPRDLRDFKPYNRTEEDCKFSHLGFAIPNCKDCRECYVKRPFQSWGYVEATEPRQTAD